MRTDPAISLLLGLPFWALLPVAFRSDMAQGAALAALAWSMLLLSVLLLRRMKRFPAAMILAAALLLLPFLPLPVALTLSAVLVILCTWLSSADFRRRGATLAAASVPPLMVLSASVMA